MNEKSQWRDHGYSGDSSEISQQLRELKAQVSIQKAENARIIDDRDKSELLCFAQIE